MKWTPLLFVIVLPTSVTLAALPSPQAVDQLVEDYLADSLGPIASKIE